MNTAAVGGLKQGEIKDLYSEVQDLIKGSQHNAQQLPHTRNQEITSGANKQHHQTAADYQQLQLVGSPRSVSLTSESAINDNSQITHLKKTNDLLKKKLNQLTLALDLQLQGQRQGGGSAPTSADQLQVRGQMDLMQGLIKQKDQQLAQMKQQMEQMSSQQSREPKQAAYIPNGYDKVHEYIATIKDLEQRNSELSKELKSMNRIQIEQGRALEKLSDEHDYPQRIKALVDELRCSKERVRVLEGRLRQEEKNNREQQEHMVRMEETIREMKGLGRRAQVLGKGGAGSEVNKPYHLMKADEKIEELNRVIDLLTKTKEKYYKHFIHNKHKYEKQIKELQERVDDQAKQLVEKDKELKVQAFKLIELMHDEFRHQNIKKNYPELERISSPRHDQRKDLDPNLQSKLMAKRQLNEKYGKLPLKPGFNKRKLDFNEKMDLLSLEIYGNGESRSKSVEPMSKQGKRLNRTQLDLDKAADQIIENNLNQYVTEVQNEIEMKMYEQSNQNEEDYLENMYDNVGGRVFDINHDLNVSTNPYSYGSRL